MNARLLAQALVDAARRAGTLLSLTSHPWNHVHQAADAFAPRVERAFAGAFAGARTWAQGAGLREALAKGDEQAVLTAISGALEHAGAELQDNLEGLLAGTLVAGAKAAGNQLRLRAAIGNGNNQYVHDRGSASAKATDARGAHKVDSSTDLSGTQNRAFLMNPKTGSMVVSKNTEYASENDHAQAAADAGLSSRQYDLYSVHGYISRGAEGDGIEDDYHARKNDHHVRITRFSNPRDEAKTSDEKHAVLNKLIAHGISKSSSFSSGYRARSIHEELKNLAAPLTIDARFDVTNPKATAWAKQRAADLVTNVTRSVRDKINGLVEEAFTDQYDVDALAAEIDEVLGGDPARAKLIARTETMAAANQGQLAAWDEAEAEGKLTGQEKKTWIVTPDDKLCPVCAPMEDVTIPRDEDFDVDGEALDGPPAHPNCRCTIGLVL